MTDPFAVLNAELATPADIALEFVKDHTEYAKISAHEHTLIWGSRGSGKTMHVRVLEPAAWIARSSAGDAATAFREFLTSADGFIGVYLNCRDAVLNRQEFRVIDKLPEEPLPFVRTLADRYLAQAVLDRLAATFTEQLKFFADCAVSIDDLPLTLRFGFEASVTLGDYWARITRDAALNLDRMRHLYDDLLSNPNEVPEDSTWIGQLPSALPDVGAFLGVLKRSLGVSAPFFLMFDEANELSPSFQRMVSELIAQRSQRTVCIKVASQLHGFRTDRPDARPVQQTHDFVSIDLDGLYTNNQDAYYNRVRGIASHRLRRAGIDPDVDKYLPPNPRDVELYARAREMAAQRYDDLPESTRPKDRSNFIKKYAPAIVFQELASGKAGKSYAGFDNLVHLSSGIVRYFLDCCSLMYARYVESKGGPPSTIPISIQNEVIETYSDDYIATIQARIDALLDDSVERRLYMDLLHLVQGMGRLFKARLMNRESREPRIISISLKDDPSDRLSRVIRLAEQDAYLQKVWYRSKRGTGKLVCFVLNRRLCPHFGLDIKGFQGRIELSAAELEAALESPDGFVRAVGQPLSAGTMEPRLAEW